MSKITYDNMLEKLETSPWEEEMIESLAERYKISEENVLEIAITVLLSELDKARMNEPTMYSQISTSLIKYDMENKNSETTEIIDINDES